MAKTGLIISAYNKPETLILCLKSIAFQTIMPDEVIIADDGSEEENRKLVSKFAETLSLTLKYVWHEDNGFRLSRIRNLAIKDSESDYLIFIDSDIILHPQFVEDHINNRRPHFFITGSRVLISKEETFDRLKSGKVDFEVLPVGCTNKLNGIRSRILSKLFSTLDNGIFNVRGCNMSFWKNDLLEVNGFDEQFEGWGREDSDIVVRLLSIGKTKFKLKFNAVQYHLFHTPNDRNLLSINDKILSETISQKRTKAVIGIDQL